jgi:DeoR family fructose operon transcriptional repressor
MAVVGTLSAESRRAGIRRALAADGQLRLADVARRWEVHPMTVRRDFEALEREGVARRVRGGLVRASAEGFARRQARALGSKRRIAAKLRPLVPNSRAVGFDSSTTVHQLALDLPPVEGLSVITNGLTAFEALSRRRDVRAFLTGGEGEEHNISLVGALAVRSLEHFLLHRCFISTTGLDPVLGTSEATIEEVAVKEAIAGAARHVVLAADSSKLGTQSLVRSLGLDRVDLLVTELAPEDPRLDPYRDRVELL